MDTYLKPVIDVLLKLWVGINMYGISKSIGQKQFQFHGILTWTIRETSGIYIFVVYGIVM